MDTKTIAPLVNDTQGQSADLVNPIDIQSRPKKRRFLGSGTPTDPSYWTAESAGAVLAWTAISNYEYCDWLSGRQIGEYRGVTLGLCRRLKYFPEWAGLSNQQAANALEKLYLQTVGWEISEMPEFGLTANIACSANYGRRRERKTRTGDKFETAWRVAIHAGPNINGLSPQEDFEVTWRGVRQPQNPWGSGQQNQLDVAIGRALQCPVKFGEEFRERLGCRMDSGFITFTSMVLYLAHLNGPKSYMILPQSRIADIMQVPQQRISVWVRKLLRAGVLRLIAPYQRGERAARYHCNYTVANVTEPFLKVEAERLHSSP